MSWPAASLAGEVHWQYLGPEAGSCTVKSRHSHFCLNVLCHWLKYVWLCYSKFQLWLLERVPKRILSEWECSMSFSLGRSWGTVIIMAVFGGRGWADTLCVSTFIPAEGSRGSQGHVQPFLQLKGKWRAPLYELEQSEWNHQLNLRMSWGSQCVPP